MPLRLTPLGATLLAALLLGLAYGYSPLRSLLAGAAAFAVFRLLTARPKELPPRGAAKKVAVIGGGLSGMVTIKELIDEGHEPTCFEKEAEFGGVWNFKTPGGVWTTTVATASTMFMEFSDYGIPDGLPYQKKHFLRHDEYFDYLQRYMAHFKLQPYFRFSSRCERVERKGDGYVVTVSGPGGSRSDYFDAVIVCSGIHQEERRPDIPGLDKFKGEIMHSNNLKDPKRLAGKRVLLIGGGETSTDLVPEIADVAKSLHISQRHGAYYAPRWINGLPGDSIVFRVFHCLPTWYKVSMSRWPILTTIIWGLPFLIKHVLFGHTTPEYTIWKRMAQRHGGTLFSGSVTKSFEVFKPVTEGRAFMKLGVKEFNSSGVMYEDGEAAEVDVVVLSTGFRTVFPFLDPKTPTDSRDFWKNMALPDYPNMLFVGFCRPILGSMPPMCEMQARFAAMVLGGRIKLPEPDQMRQIIQDEKMFHKTYFYTCTERLTYQVDYNHYMNFLSDQLGCTPIFWRLVFKPKLLMKVMWGSMTPPQFRLVGPHAAPEQAESRVMEVPIAGTHPSPPPPARVLFFLLYCAFGFIYAATGIERFKTSSLA